MANIFKKVVSSIFGRAKTPVVKPTKNGVFKKQTNGKVEEPYEVQESDLLPEDGEQLQAVDEAKWYDLVSTNVDRIRWGSADKKLQVIFKNGSLYEYDAVEPETFLAFLGTHSPGQFVWNVLRQYGYTYRKLSTGHATAPPAADRFSGQPFAVPAEIEAIQAKAGRKPVEGTDYFNVGTPVAEGVTPPPATLPVRR